MGCMLHVICFINWSRVSIIFTLKVYILPSYPFPSASLTLSIALSPYTVHIPLSVILCTPLTSLPQGMMHRDLNPNNIFLSNDGNIKIGDFGCSTRSGFDSCRDVGTSHYRAPEIDLEEYDSRVGIPLFSYLSSFSFLFLFVLPLL